MAPDASPFTSRADGLLVALRVTPRARRDGIGGTIAGADGEAALKVAVTAAPEDGRANEAVLALLAKTWRIPKSRLSIAHGVTARRKTVRIAGDGPLLKQRLDTWLRELHE